MDPGKEEFWKPATKEIAAALNRTQRSHILLNCKGVHFSHKLLSLTTSCKIINSKVARWYSALIQYLIDPVDHRLTSVIMAPHKSAQAHNSPPQENRSILN